MDKTWYVTQESQHNVQRRFPLWKQVIPSFDVVHQVFIHAGSLQQAVRQAAIVTAHESRAIDLVFDEGDLTIKAKTAEIGESEVHTLISYSDERVDISIDNRYALDVCGVVDPQSLITLEFESESRPIKLSTDDGYECVIMPLSKQS